MKRDENEQRHRLSRFVDLAKVYRGWTRTELSKVLGRDPSKIVPESGNPKLDLIVNLADVLDWNVGDVAESVWIRNEGHAAAEGPRSFETLSQAAIDARHAGRFDEVIELTRQMRMVATTPRQHAIACLREGSVWDRRGRYTRALECAQEGLAVDCQDHDVATTLQGRLANGHYTLWHLIEARAVAQDLIDRLEHADLSDPVIHENLGIAHYARGHASRRTLSSGPDATGRESDAAVDHLRRAIEIYEDLRHRRDRPTDEAISKICSGGILELEAASGAISADNAMDEILASLDDVVDLENCPSVDLLECRGWWAIFGCNIALRHFDGDEMNRHMAILTNKALEIAEKIGNWGLRERAFTLEHFRRQQVPEAAASDHDWVLDDDEVRTITGTMGRFPGFRRVGWHILESARIFEAAS